VLYLKQARRTHEEAFTHERSISILREAEAGAMRIKALCKKHDITDQAFFRWRNKSGDRDVPDAQRLKDLEPENSRLKRLVAEQMLVIDGMRRSSEKNDDPGGTARVGPGAGPPGSFATQGLPESRREPAHKQLQAEAAGQGSGGGQKAAGGIATSAQIAAASPRMTPIHSHSIINKSRKSA